MTEGCDDFWILVVINPAHQAPYSLSISLYHTVTFLWIPHPILPHSLTLRPYALSPQSCARASKNELHYHLDTAFDAADDAVTLFHPFIRLLIIDFLLYRNIDLCSAVMAIILISSLVPQCNSDMSLNGRLSFPSSSSFLSSLITLFHTWVEPSRRASKALTEWVDTSLSRIHTIEIADCGVGERESDRVPSFMRLRDEAA